MALTARFNKLTLRARRFSGRRTRPRYPWFGQLQTLLIWLRIKIAAFCNAQLETSIEQEMMSGMSDGEHKLVKIQS
jgi:hypothetical protein